MKKLGEINNTCSLHGQTLFCIIKVKYSQSQIGGRNREKHFGHHRKLLKKSIGDERERNR